MVAFQCLGITLGVVCKSGALTFADGSVLKAATFLGAGWLAVRCDYSEVSISYVDSRHGRILRILCLSIERLGSGCYYVPLAVGFPFVRA